MSARVVDQRLNEVAKVNLQLFILSAFTDRVVLR
jgi:hypothetical protein